MGNKHSNEPLENFVQELSLRELHNIPDADIKIKLESILSYFRSNKNYFSECRIEEDRERNLGNHFGASSGGQKDSGEIAEDEEEANEDDMRKTRRFCKVITFMIKLSFSSEFQDNYLLLLEIMTYMIKEREFLRYFFYNSVETLCNMATTSSTYSKKFYQKSTELMIEVLDIVIKEPKLISENLSGLRKMMILPKKLLDGEYCREYKTKMNLLVLMKLNLQIMRDLNEAAIKDKSQGNSKEFMDFVKNTISEYHNTSVFAKLSEDLVKKDTDTTTHKLIVESFNFLSQIEFVISDQIIRCEKEVKSMFTILEKSNDDELIQESLKFLINFYVISFNLEQIGNFKLFLVEGDSELEEKIFSLFLKDNTSSDVKFLICCLFFCVSIVEEIWNKLRGLNLIKPTVRYMIKYITNFFNPKTYKEGEPEIIKKMNKISVLVRIFTFLSDDKNVRRIVHVDFFKFYFEVVLILFHVYHVSFRVEILAVLNVFTYYYDCKAKMLEDKNRPYIEILHKRLDELFHNLKKLYSIYSDCHENKNRLVQQKGSVNNVEYKHKYEENILMLDDLLSNTKGVFFKTTHEFGLLMSILTNLLLNNDYNSFIRRITLDRNFFREKRGKNKDEGKGMIVQFDEFFKSIDLFKNDLKNTSSQYEYINKYIRQVVITRLINDPKVRIESSGKSEDDTEDNLDINNLNVLYEMMRQYKTDGDILHKIIFAMNRFFSFSRKFKIMIDTIKKIIEEVKSILFNDYQSSIIVNRECLRLLCAMTMFSDNTLLWLKFDSKKVHVDYSNYSDVMLKYTDPDTEWEPEDEEKERIIFPPYMKVKSYADKMGVIFYGDHVIILPKRLQLGNTFTIWFRFFNPVINSKNWHVLLQDPNGLGGLICIDSSRRRLGCFTADGEFIDSGVDLNEPELKKKWVQVAMSFKSIADSIPVMKEKDSLPELEKSEQSRLDWYVNSQMRKSYASDKIILPKTLQYVGNSRDCTEPFGVFCDVRIYKTYLNQNQIQHIYHGEESRKVEKNEYDLLYYIYLKAVDGIIENFLLSSDISEETFYFAIKFFNNIMANRSHRSKFLNYQLIMKVCNYFSCKKVETKKEVAKFMQTIS